MPASEPAGPRTRREKPASCTKYARRTPRIAGPRTSYARHMPRIAARCTKRKSTMNLTPVHSPGFLGREQPKLVQRPDYLGRRRARPAGRSEFQTQTPKALVHRQVFLGTSLSNPVQRPVFLDTAQRVDRWRQSEGPNRRHASTALSAWTVRDSLKLQTVVLRPQKRPRRREEPPAGTVP